VLTLFRERGLKPPMVYEVRELQTALGLVAAEVGVCLVPVSVERLRRDNVVYRPLDEEKAVSPIIMSTRKGDRSSEITLILKLIREIYRNQPRRLTLAGELSVRLRLWVISGCASPPAAWQVNLNKRTPELERAHLAIRHPPAGRQRVRPAQLTLSDPLHDKQPTADRVVSAE
jgi:hypothetical protein